MTLQTPPFTRTRLDEEKLGEDKIFTVRLNAREVEQLELMKRVLQIEGDSTALKRCSLIGINVLHNLLGEDFLAKYLKKKP